MIDRGGVFRFARFDILIRIRSLTHAGLFTLTFLCAFVLHGEVTAGEFKLTPSAGLKGEYHDNLFFTEKRKKDEWITTLSPGIELSHRTERLDLNVLGRASFLFYADYHEFNDVDHFYRGRARFSLHPKWSVSGEAAFTRDSTVDRDIEATGLVNKTIRRYKYNLSGGVQHSLTETTLAELSYAFERFDYERDPEFVDIDSHGVTLVVTHDLSKRIPKTVGRANLGYARYEFDVSEIDYYYGTLGASHALSEKWSFLVDAGASYTYSRFEIRRLSPFGIIRDHETKDGVGWVGQATITYRGERTARGDRTRGDLTFQHRLLPSSGKVGVTRRTSIVLEGVHYFTYELSGRISAGYYLNRSRREEFSTTPVDEATFRIHPRFRYEFTRDIALEASYHYTYIRNRETRSEAHRNLFMINFYIQHPLFE